MSDESEITRARSELVNTIYKAADAYGSIDGNRWTADPHGDPIDSGDRTLALHRQADPAAYERLHRLRQERRDLLALVALLPEIDAPEEKLLAALEREAAEPSLLAVALKAESSS